MSSLSDIPRLGFQPPAGYAFDIEVFTAHEWLQRVPEDHIKYPSRLDFHQLILVTQGQFAHTVDFKRESVRAGSIVVMWPGQVQQFEPNKPWDGWVVIFRPESIQSSAGTASPASGFSAVDIPVQIVLEKGSFEPVRDAMAQMHQDARLSGQKPLVGALGQAQLQALLIRLQLGQKQLQVSPENDALLTRHFRRFQQATEQRLCEWHQIALYARALGISEKTLSRATQKVAGLSAKAYLSKRIALEAKRMLAYTRWPIAQVADTLGFDEPTNFIKFFRREAGFAPREFRKHHRGQRSPGQPLPAD